MKKIVVISLFVFFTLSPKVHAAGVAQAGLLGAIYGQLFDTEVMNVARQAAHIAEMLRTVKNTYDQLQNMIRAEKRALDNLKSIVDIRSYSDFVKWQNRTLYLARREEEIFNNMGVNIDGKNYKVRDMDEIPGALRDSFSDPFNKDFTEEEKRDMYLKMGLTPGNYLYLKTWEQRNDAIAKKIRTYGEIHEEETEEAAARNQNIIDKYKTSSEDLDINEISKEAHITAMNQEMLLRELIRRQNEMYEYELSRDRKAQTPPSPPIPTYIFNFDPYSSITRGHSQDNYHD